MCPLCISALSDIISDQISWVVKVPYTVLNGTNVPLFGTNFLCLQTCGYCVEVDKVLGVVVLGVGVSLCGHVSLVQGQFHQKLMWLLLPVNIFRVEAVTPFQHLSFSTIKKVDIVHCMGEGKLTSLAVYCKPPYV